LHDICLWWQPGRSEVFGYLNGWTANGSVFYYTGSGQRGDQVFDSPHVENGRVRDHVANGDAIRLLRYLAKNQVEYLGKLALDTTDPFRLIDAYDAEGNMRKVIQFRFLPVGEVKKYASDPTRETLLPGPLTTEVEPVPPLPDVVEVEAVNAETFVRRTLARDAVAKRAESLLVHAFKDWLAGRGGQAVGLRVPYGPEARNLRADLFLPAARVLVEAKASSSREAIRMAIGQLLDYERFIRPAPLLCVLLPTPPPDDMVRLLETLSISAVWREGRGFVGEPMGFLDGLS
jgi:hypothetical protein